MSASSRDLSIPDGLILFLPAVPGMLFLYIAEVIPKVCAGLGLELGLSGYALLEAVFIGCALSPAAEAGPEGQRQPDAQDSQDHQFQHGGHLTPGSAWRCGRPRRPRTRR